MQDIDWVESRFQDIVICYASVVNLMLFLVMAG